MISSEVQKEFVTILEAVCTMYEGKEFEWLTDLRKNLADIDPFTEAGLDDVEDGIHRKPNVPLLPILFKSLQASLLSRRWLEAVKILEKICQIPVNTSATIWKVGKYLIEHNPEKCDIELKDLYNKVKMLPDINFKEVVLEYAMYLLTQGDSVAVRETIQEHVIKSGVKKEKTERDKYIQVLYMANTGLLWYMEWLACSAKLDAIQTDDDEPVSYSLSQVSGLEMQKNNCASKAIRCFQGLSKETGVWDIFIDKYVKLLLYFEMTGEALEVLQGYSSKNETNPNAQKYLYHFYKEHYPDKDYTINQLKAVVKSVPSDSLVLDLCKHLKKDRCGEMMGHLFDLLDHVTWQMECQPWQMLAESLIEMCENDNRQEELSEDLCVLKDCWALRQAWWPDFHFHPSIASTQPGTSIIYFKALVACFFCGPNHEFCVEANNFLDEQEMENFERQKKKFERVRSKMNIIPT